MAAQPPGTASSPYHARVNLAKRSDEERCCRIGAWHFGSGFPHSALHEVDVHIGKSDIPLRTDTLAVPGPRKGVHHYRILVRFGVVRLVR